MANKDKNKRVSDRFSYTPNKVAWLIVIVGFLIVFGYGACPWIVELIK